MTITFVQATSGSTTGTAISQAYATNNSANDLLLCATRVGGSASATVTITDTQSNSGWSLAKSQGQTTDGHVAALNYCAGCKAGANTVTATQSGSSATMYIGIAEYSGLATSSPLDGAPVSAQGGSNTAIASGNMTATTNSTDLLIGVSSNSVGFTTAPTYNSWGSSITQTARVTAQAASIKLIMSEGITTATGTYALSITGSASSYWTAIAAAFSTVSGAITLTGQRVTSGQGTMTPGASIGMSQNLATSAIGSPTPTISIPLTGLQIVSAQGALATALILQHLVATLAQGSMAPGSGVLMGGLSISTYQGSFTVKVQNRTNLPTAPPTTRTVNMQALSYEVDGPVKPYPIYQFSRGRTFIKRPYQNDAAGEVQGASSSGGGPGL